MNGRLNLRNRHSSIPTVGMLISNILRRRMTGHKNKSTATRAMTKRLQPVKTPRIGSPTPVDPFLTVAQRLQSINSL